jgi:hypothetical protein
MLDDKGKSLWEKNDFTSIRELEIYGPHLVVLDKQNIRIFRVEREKEIATFTSARIRRGRDIVQSAVVGEDDLLLQLGDGTFPVATTVIHYSAGDKTLTEIDVDLKCRALITKIDHKGVMFDYEHQSLYFIQ